MREVLFPDGWPLARSIRALIGAFTPLAIALATGHLKQGLWVFLGVLLLTMGEKELSYPARMRHGATAAVIGVFGYLVGALVPGTGGAVWQLVVLLLAMAAAAFLAGVMSTFGPAWSSGAMLLLMLAATSMDDASLTSHAAAAAWYLVGVVCYLVLLGAEAVVLRDRPERLALARTERALLRYAAVVQQQAGPVPATTGLPLDPRTADPATLARRALAQAADWTRAVVSPTRWREPAQARLAVVDDDAAQVTAARFLPTPPTPRGFVRPPRGFVPNAERVRAHGERVHAQRREGSRARREGSRAPARGLVPDPNAAHPLRRHLRHPGHDALLQGVRLALCMVAAVGVHLVLRTPHSYWVVVAVALIMKPDLGSVYARAIQRALGAIGGVAIGWVVFLLVPPGWWHVLVIAVLTALQPWAKSRGYVWQAVLFTPVVLVFTNLVLPGTTRTDYGPERLAATALAAAIVVVLGFAIWPRSRHPRVAGHVTAVRRDVAAQLRAVAAADGSDPAAAQVHRTRMAAEHSGAALRAQLTRMLQEPSGIASQAAAWAGASAVLERLTELATASATVPDLEPMRGALERAATLLNPAGRGSAMEAGAPAEAAAGGTTDVVATPGAPAAADSHPDLATDMVLLAQELAALIPPAPSGRPARKERAE